MTEIAEKELSSPKETQAPKNIEEFVQGLLPTANKPAESSSPNSGFG